MVVVQPRKTTVEQLLAQIAGKSHGVVTRAQLSRAGITPEEIKQRVRRGTLLRVHRGVYRVGHRAPSIEARYVAAVRACGEGALLSGPAAAHLLGLIRSAAPPQVTAPQKRRVAGVVTRRARIDPRDATVWRGIPVTTVARTLVDLAAALSSYALARACHEAGVRHHTTPAQVDAALGRQPNALGARRLRQILHGEVRISLSRLEARVLALLSRHDLALPLTNIPAGGRRVDCRWPEHRLTVEIDSYRFHRSRHAWEQDRRREREAYARGDEFRRYTHDDVVRSRAMLRELRELLSRPVNHRDRVR